MKFTRLMLCLLLFLATAQMALAQVVDRRKDQFETSSGYLVVPAPYELPGLGSGWMLIGYGGNVAETPVDIFTIAFQGDASGYIIVADEMYLWPKTVYAVVNQMHVSKFGVNFYNSRGMDSEKDDYYIYVGNRYFEFNRRLIYTAWEKRIELNLNWQDADGRTQQFLNSDGDLVQEFEEDATFKSKRFGKAFKLDFTDDYKDPRQGFRVEGSMQTYEAQTDDAPTYDVYSYDLAYYVPLLTASTWAFNYFRSDAIVTKEGDTDLESLKTKNNYYACPYTADQASCENAALRGAETAYKANKYGTAMPLGGASRLRSYPFNRYSAAHTVFYGTELRWNYSTDSTKLDLFFLNDIQQALQFSVFWEQGSVAELASELGDITRSSYGLGARLVTKSGNIYRADYATGEEGGLLTIVFNYPWVDAL